MSPARRRRSDRSGMAYVAVLCIAMLVAIMGVGALSVGRVDREALALRSDAAEARALAESAIELGRVIIGSEPEWREDRASGVWLSNVALGRGTITLTVVDPADADLSDNALDTVVLTGTGGQGGMRRRRCR